MQQLVTFDAARALVLAHAPLLPEERVPLAKALGRTLAAPVVSREAIPPFTNAAMDGYAVRAADLAGAPRTLRVIADVPAGSFPQDVIVEGTCARIMTGAPVPRGADAVVQVEWTEPAGEASVRVLERVAPGQNVREAGEDVSAGAQVLPPGERVTPPVIGMLATLGYAEVSVRRAPRVAVVATGDELVDAAATPGPGQIRNANGPALAAQVASAGGEVVVLLHAGDDRAGTEAAVEQSLAADVLVFSGGVSVGAYDFVRQVLEARGTRFLFWRVRQRPGKPLAFGVLGHRPVFGLPGNPVSSAVCFEQYVRPALAQMLGRREVVRPRYPALLDAPTAKKAGLHHFVRGVARVDAAGRMRVRDTGPQGSNLYSSMVAANCIVHLPEEMEEAPAGAPVEIEWLTW